MADLSSPIYPRLADLIDPYLSLRERQTNESKLADLLLPKALPEYLQGLAYGTLPKEAPFTSMQSTATYVPAALDIMTLAPMVRTLGDALLQVGKKGVTEAVDSAARAVAEGRRMVPPGQINMGVGPAGDAAVAALNQSDPATRAMITNDLKARGLRDVQITDGVIRDEIARRNAVTMLGLPEGNTAADRAKAMGYTKDAYHGSKSDFSKIDKKARGSGSGSPDTAGFFASSNPRNASEYADFSDGSDVYKRDALNKLKQLKKKYPESAFYAAAQRQGNPDLSNEIDRFYLENPLNLPKVYPLKIKADNNKYLNWEGRPWDPTMTGSLYKSAKKGSPGVTNAKIRDWVDDNWNNPSATTYVQFDPSTVRSRFAAFDPARSKEADILAGLGAAAVTTPAALYLADMLRMKDRSGL